MKKEITYDELLSKIPNKYVLTIVCGERARERAKERMERNWGEKNFKGNYNSRTYWSW